MFHSFDIIAYFSLFPCEYAVCHLPPLSHFPLFSLFFWFYSSSIHAVFWEIRYYYYYFYYLGEGGEGEGGAEASWYILHEHTRFNRIMYKPDMNKSLLREWMKYQWILRVREVKEFFLEQEKAVPRKEDLSSFCPTFSLAAILSNPKCKYVSEIFAPLNWTHSLLFDENFQLLSRGTSSSSIRGEKELKY